MDEAKKEQKCFIIMPITTPEFFIGQYKDDADHFSHVLECLFMPAVKKAGFEPIPPKSTGSDVIHAEIIRQLSECELVLCDMSILNPNVFFEFGIRTALNKPVALIADEKTKIPFDTSIINFHKYSSSLDAWSIEKEKENLSEHIKKACEKTKDHNALWKYFGVAQTGMFKPEEATIGDKIDLLMKEVTSLKSQKQAFIPTKFREVDEDTKDVYSFLQEVAEKKQSRDYREKLKAVQKLVEEYEKDMVEKARGQDWRKFL